MNFRFRIFNLKFVLNLIPSFIFSNKSLIKFSTRSSEAILSTLEIGLEIRTRSHVARLNPRMTILPFLETSWKCVYSLSTVDGRKEDVAIQGGSESGLETVRSSFEILELTIFKAAIWKEYLRKSNFFFFNSQNEYLRISNHSINRIRKKERKIKIAINRNEFEKCVSSIISNFYRAFNISMRSFYGGRAIRMFNLEQRGKIYYAKSLTERREAGMSKWK